MSSYFCLNSTQEQKFSSGFLSTEEFFQYFFKYRSTNNHKIKEADLKKLFDTIAFFGTLLPQKGNFWTHKAFDFFLEHLKTPMYTKFEE